MALTADDANYLIYRYLQESGLVHSAYIFALETNVTKQERDHSQSQQGCLVKLIQRGLQYVELEANLSDDGTYTEGPFEVLSAEQIMTSTEAELKEAVQQARRESSPNDQSPEPPEMPCSTQGLTLTAHQGEVFGARWSPNGSHLASYGGNDRVCKVWVMGSSFDAQQGAPTKQLDLEHPPRGKNGSNDVNDVVWRPDSLFLATGAEDGIARIWKHDGNLHKELKGHKDAILGVQYSPDGHVLLSASLDNSLILWDADTGATLQQMTTHREPVLCSAWSGDMFATGSHDHSVHVFKAQPGAGDAPFECKQVRDLRGHSGSVVTVQWAPNGWLLASGAEDFAAMLWNTHQDSPLCKLVDDDAETGASAHTSDVNLCCFRPAGYGSHNPNLSLKLATASFDNTVKIWDCQNGSLQHSLDRHSKAVYTCDWSPNGDVIATGAHDGRVILWDVHEGTVIKTYNAGCGVFDVKWHQDGRRIAVATKEQLLCVLDIRL